MAFPAGIIEIFVEQHDRSWLKAIGQSFKDIHGGRIKIAVDMHESHRAGMRIAPEGEGVAEPAFIEGNVLRHFWETPAHVECIFAQVESAPGLGQAFKTVKAMKADVGQTPGHIPHRAAGKYAELHVMARNFRLAEAMRYQLFLRIETQRVGHVLLEVVDAGFERPDGTLAHRVQPAGIEQLVTRKHDFIKRIFEAEISDEHLGFTLAILTRPHTRSGGEHACNALRRKRQVLPPGTRQIRTDGNPLLTERENSLIINVFTTNDYIQVTVLRSPINLPVLTGLRCVAALSVLFGHAVQVSFPASDYGGLNFLGERLAFYAMSIFFVLSGCVLTLNYSDRIAVPGHKIRNILLFWGARLARLLPLYYLALIFYLAATPWDNPVLWSLLPQYLTLTQSWYNIWLNGKMNIHQFYPHSWSVSTEIFFYLSFPAIIWLLTPIRSIRMLRRILVGYFLLLALLWIDLLFKGYALHFMLKSYKPIFLERLSDAAFFSPYWRLAEFIAGCVIGKIIITCRHNEISTDTLLHRFLSYGAVALITASLCPMLNQNISSIFNNLFIYSVVSSMIFSGLVVALVYSLCMSNTAISRLLSLKPALFIGEISYSIYLLHIIVLSHYENPLTSLPELKMIDNLLRLACMLSLTVIVAYGSYLGVEVPSRRFLRRLFGVQGKPVL